MSENYADLTLAELRRKLCEAQRGLRINEAETSVIRAVAEQHIIDEQVRVATLRGIAPARWEERTRSLILGLGVDPGYRSHVLWVEHLQAQVDSLRTELDIRLDQRVDAQWAIRDRLAAALEMRNMPDTAERARERVAATMEPLPGIDEPEQAELALDTDGESVRI